MPKDIMGSVATMSIFWAALKAATAWAPSRFSANCTRMAPMAMMDAWKPMGRARRICAQR